MQIPSETLDNETDMWLNVWSQIYVESGRG